MARAPRSIGESAVSNPAGRTATRSGKVAPTVVDAMAPRAISVRPNSGGMPGATGHSPTQMNDSAAGCSFPSFSPNSNGLHAPGMGPKGGGGMKGH